MVKLTFTLTRHEFRNCRWKLVLGHIWSLFSVFYELSTRKELWICISVCLCSDIQKLRFYPLCSLTFIAISNGAEKDCLSPMDMEAFTQRAAPLGLVTPAGCGLCKDRAGLMHRRKPCQEGITHISQAEGRKKRQF